MEIVIDPGGAAAAASSVAASFSSPIGNAASSLAVVFGTPFGSTDYFLVTSITNVTDAVPIMLQIVSTTKSSTGFTATFNAPTDSANYILEYAIGAYV